MLHFPCCRICLGLWLFCWNKGFRWDEAATPGCGVCHVTLGTHWTPESKAPAVNSLVERHFTGVFRASLRQIRKVFLSQFYLPFLIKRLIWLSADLSGDDLRLLFFFFFSKIKSTFKGPGFISFGNAWKGYSKRKKQFDGFKTLTFMEPPKDDFF